MHKLLTSTVIGILALATPAAVLANISGTITLAQNQALNLDMGTVVTSGGDILWTTVMTPQGKAGAFNLSANGGALVYNSLTQSTLSFLQYSSAPISGSFIAVNDVFAVKTNGGNYAAVFVSGLSGNSPMLTFTTFGVTNGPNITQVLNNYSYTPAGFPNSGIAQGALFVVVGTTLADPTKGAVLQDSTMGLPTTLNGSSVKVTSSGVTVTPAFYYTSATQLALVLPSNTPVGTAQMTVTYNNQTSSPYTFQVVQTAPGFATYYGTGTGLGAALNPANYVPYSYANPIPPGTTVVLYGSGLGADMATDTTFVGKIFNINNLAHIYVGGVDAPILYQGSFYYPGLNQINVTIPATAPTGCNVPLTGVTAAGLPTNFITLPIGIGPCSDPAFGSSGNQLLALSSQVNVKTGFVILSHGTSGAAAQVTDAAAATFQSYTGAGFGTGSGLVSLNGCIVSQAVGTASAGTTTGLDAGNIKVTNPTGMSTLLSTIPGMSGFYAAQLLNGFIPTSGGSFTFNGGGGVNVGSFGATVVFPTPLMTWTNQAAAASVMRSAGLPLTWSGGASSSFISITGSSSASGSTASFTCLAPASAGQFTVPGYVLSALPAGNGSISVSNQTNYTPFAATGLDLGIALGSVSYQVNATFN